MHQPGDSCAFVNRPVCCCACPSTPTDRPNMVPGATAALIGLYLGLNVAINLFNRQDRAFRALISRLPRCPSASACWAPLRARLHHRGRADHDRRCHRWLLGLYGFRFPMLLTLSHLAFAWVALLVPVTRRGGGVWRKNWR